MRFEPSRDGLDRLLSSRIMDRAAVTVHRVPIALAALLGGLLLAGVQAFRPVPVVAAGQDHSVDLARVIQLTNAARLTAGLTPLAVSPQLNDAAQSYTQVLASGTCFDHGCGGVPNFADRIGQAGYTGWTAIAENIAAGYPTPDAVVAGWMASPGHRANILSPSYSEIGVGEVMSGGKYGTYWTQEFGSRPGPTLDVAPPPAPDDASVAPAPGDADPEPGE
jgi:uncharacterized protein YkwD